MSTPLPTLAEIRRSSRVAGKASTPCRRIVETASPRTTTPTIRPKQTSDGACDHGRPIKRMRLSPIRARSPEAKAFDSCLSGIPGKYAAVRPTATRPMASSHRQFSPPRQATQRRTKGPASPPAVPNAVRTDATIAATRRAVVRRLRLPAPPNRDRLSTRNPPIRLARTTTYALASLSFVSTILWGGLPEGRSWR
jgi:hypothetical protein